VDYVACPDDSAHLKVDLETRVAGQPLILTCTTCGRVFRLDRDGVREIPPGEDSK
jgi:uncharacterized protein YbaR (Trm112 family)